MKTVFVSRVLFAVAVMATAFSASSRADVQRDFFEAIQSGQIEQVMAQMRPELLVEVDPPVLAAWMTALNERVGSLQSIKYTGIELKQTEDGSFRTTTAIVTFEKGSATSVLTAIDDRLIAFQVTSDQLGNDWFQGPSSIDLYESRGRTFIEQFMTGKTDEAYAMCHPALQDVIDRESFQQMVNILHERHGGPTSVTLKDSSMKIDDERQELTLNFDIVGERGTGVCEITVQFAGMKGHLLGFNFR